MILEEVKWTPLHLIFDLDIETYNVMPKEEDLKAFDSHNVAF